MGGDAVDSIEPCAAGLVVAPHDGGAALWDRNQRQSGGRGERVEIDHAVGRDILLIVVAHHDEDGVVPRGAQRLDDHRD